ncbi:MAG TPA: molybdopterin molybdenumtransferase MoeA, partial [Pasteurellaceae bacterium]|nr:molybdopterin molybdenumtransferase MoeA [Pasteurellaceae bacterium]
MLSLEQALEQILASVPTPPSDKTEILSIEQAQNRICAEDIISPINVPS